MASSQYNSVYDMFKDNASKTGKAPDPNEPDPNAPIYSMYGNNQFGSPVLPDQKPNFNSVYDIYGQGKMNDWSGGAVKTPKSPLDKPNQNPTIGNPARPPVVSDPFVPADPSAPDDSGVEDDPYTPGSSSGGGGGGSIDLTKPVPPGQPPPLDKQADPAAPPAPPGGGSGGGSGGGGGGSGGGGGGDPAGDLFRKQMADFDAGYKGYQPPGGGSGSGSGGGGNGGGGVFNFQVPAGSGGEPPPEIGGAPTDSPVTKEEALENGYLDPVDGVSPVPLYTEWDGEKMVIHWSDGYSEPSEAFGGKGRQFKNQATSPVNSSPGTNYDGGAGGNHSEIDRSIDDSMSQTEFV